VAIARALLGAPGLMLFDEPSQGLAPKIVDDVLGVIRKLKGAGIASVVVEQNADVALGVADRVVVLAHGQVAWSGEAAALTADPGLKRQLLGGIA
jgi:branched-chain amino acid transport system ATP-binding protein